MKAKKSEKENELSKLKEKCELLKALIKNTYRRGEVYEYVNLQSWDEIVNAVNRGDKLFCKDYAFNTKRELIVSKTLIHKHLVVKYPHYLWEQNENITADNYFPSKHKVIARVHKDLFDLSDDENRLIYGD